MASFTVIDAVKVNQLANKALDAIEIRREIVFVRLAGEAVERRNKWRRWLPFLPKIKVGSAEAFIAETRPWVHYGVWLRSSRREGRLQTLKALAATSLVCGSGQVSVSADDCVALGLMEVAAPAGGREGTV